MIKYFTSIFVLFILIPGAQGQGKEWELQECIDYAIEHNIQIKQSEINAQISKQSVSQARASMLPTFNGFATNTYNWGQTIDPFTNQFATERVRSNSFGFNSQVTLFNGFSLYNSYRKSELDYMASKYDSDKMRDDIALNVATAYLQVLMNKSLLEIAKDQITITRQQVERTKKMVDAGTLPKSNLLDMQAQLAQEELQEVNNQNQLDISRLNLLQLMELESGIDEFELVDPEIDSPAQLMDMKKPNAIYNTALDIMPAVKSAEYKLSSSEKDLSIARGNASPSLTLSGNFGTGYSGARREVEGASVTGVDTIGFTTGDEYVLTPSFEYDYRKKPFNEQLEDNLNQSVSLQLSIPIFNGLSSRTRIKSAKLNLENARYNLDLQKNQLRKNIQSAYADALAAYKKYLASEKSVNALEEAFNYAQTRYEVGMMNAVDFNDAKNKLTKAKSELQQAKYEYVFKTKVLDFYQGQALGFK